MFVAQKRMAGFVVGLTNDDPAVTTPVFKQYRYVQYPDPLPRSETAAVRFDQIDGAFRYVVIQNQVGSGNGCICLAEVKVFVRGKSQLFLRNGVLLGTNVQGLLRRVKWRQTDHIATFGYFGMCAIFLN